MKNMIKYAFVAGMISLSFTGCIKETLSSSNAINKEQVAESPYALSSKVNGITSYVNNYDVLGREMHYDFGYPAICIIREMLSNDVATVASDYSTWFNMWSTNESIGDGYAAPQFVWNYYCKWLYTANELISIGKSATMTEENKHYLGVGYAFRALIWLDMARMYEFVPNKYTNKPEVEGLTIARMDETLTEEDARNNPRLPKAKIIEMIKDDLNNAIELLDGYAPATKSLPTKAVAYGLLARTLLWEGDYENAKTAAQDALNAGSFSPLTEAQWTDPATGFNSASSQSSWMLCGSTSAESNVVKTGIINWVSWMSSETSFGYCSAGPFRLCDASFYGMISDNDFRKKSWVPAKGVDIEVPYVPASGSYDGPETLPELAAVKFRPGSGEPNSYVVAAAIDFPMMRMEEMKFIIAECDARLSNSAASLIEIMRTRNPEYTTSLTGLNLLSEVLLQKRVEFWGEGIIFFDYKRCPEILHIYRGYEGTNHVDTECFNVPEGIAPWMNFVCVKTEPDNNSAFINNPDPSGTVPLWTK